MGYRLGWGRVDRVQTRLRLVDRIDGVDRVQTIVGVDGGIGICRRYRYVVKKNTLQEFTLDSHYNSFTYTPYTQHQCQNLMPDLWNACHMF